MPEKVVPPATMITLGVRSQLNVNADEAVSSRIKSLVEQVLLMLTCNLFALAKFLLTNFCHKSLV